MRTFSKRLVMISFRIPSREKDRLDELARAYPVMTVSELLRKWTLEGMDNLEREIGEANEGIGYEDLPLWRR